MDVEEVVMRSRSTLPARGRGPYEGGEQEEEEEVITQTPEDSRQVVSKARQTGWKVQGD